MDYVIFGIALGAALVLAGWSLQQFGPSMRYRVPPDGVQSGSQLVLKLAWARFCAAAGLVLITLGAILLLVTIVTLIVSPSDRTATRIVLVTTLLLLLAAAVWAWSYVQRFGLAGIVDQDRQRKRASALRSWSESDRRSETSAITVYGPPLPEGFAAAVSESRADPSLSPSSQEPSSQLAQHGPPQSGPAHAKNREPRQASPRFVLVRDHEPSEDLGSSNDTLKGSDDPES